LNRTKGTRTTTKKTEKNKEKETPEKWVFYKELKTP